MMSRNELIRWMQAQPSESCFIVLVDTPPLGLNVVHSYPTQERFRSMWDYWVGLGPLGRAR